MVGMSDWRNSNVMGDGAEERWRGMERECLLCWQQEECNFVVSCMGCSIFFFHIRRTKYDEGVGAGITLPAPSMLYPAKHRDAVL